MGLLQNLIPKVKCGRCDRSYSGLKLRCPYCGASRSRGGKRSVDADDANARRMMKVLLAAVLLIAVVSMVVLDLPAEPIGGGDPGGGPGMTQGGGQTGGDENGENGNGAERTPLPTPEPTPPPPVVTSVNIRWGAQQGDANDMTLRVGNEIELWSEIWPSDAEDLVRWVSDNHLVALITVDPDDHRRVTVEARSAGQTIIRATAGDESAEVIVRVRA